MSRPKRHNNSPTARKLARAGVELPQDTLASDDKEPSPEDESKWDARIKACCEAFQSVWSDADRISRRYGDEKTFNGLQYEIPEVSTEYLGQDKWQEM